MPTPAEENNILVLTALFKQIDIGSPGTINFRRLADDIPVKSENAARHRWRRCKESFTRANDKPLTTADINNNNLVLPAVFKQITIGRIDFRRLADDMGLGENAARHRYRRMLESFGIKSGGGGSGDDDKNAENKDGNKDGEKSDGVASSPVKVEANTKVVRKKLTGSPLKNEIKREGSWVETPNKGGKRKVEDEDVTDEEQGVRLMQMPAKKFPKRRATKVIEQEQKWSGDDTEDETFDGHGQDDGSGSGFEDLDYTRVAEKKSRGMKAEQSSDIFWEA